MTTYNKNEKKMIVITIYKHYRNINNFEKKNHKNKFLRSPGSNMSHSLSIPLYRIVNSIYRNNISIYKILYRKDIWISKKNPYIELIIEHIELVIQ